MNFLLFPRNLEGSRLGETTNSNRSNIAWLGLACLALAFSTSGCRWLAAYGPAPLESALCSARVVLLSDLAPVPDMQISYQGYGKASEVPELVRFDNSLQPVPLYRWSRIPDVFAPWVAEGEIPSVLRGAWLVRVDVEDAAKTDELMSLVFRQAQEIETVWVAFDTRAQEPDWLTQGFEVYGGGSGDELQITKRIAKNEPVKFRLWRLRESVDLDQPLHLGGNSDPTAIWPGETGSQYLVFVRRKAIPDINSPSVQVGEHRFEGCGSEALGTQPMADDLAIGDLSVYLGDWLQKHPDWAWAHDAGLLQIESIPGSCEWMTTVYGNGNLVTKSCGEEGVGRTEFRQWSLVNDWPVESRASIDTLGSVGRVGLYGDEPTLAPIRGTFSFRAFDDGRLMLDDVSLFAEPFRSGGLDVASATFSHEVPVEATCVGQAFPHRLCDGYLIPQGGLQLFAAARVGSYDYTASLDNAQPIQVEVDFDQRIFRLAGGPFEGAVALEDGSEIQVEASFDLVGQFDNFAPVASTEEGARRFPCVDNRQGRARLDAGASYDAEGSLVAYQWLEDAGLSTQRVLGSTAVIEVGLAFGTHAITLIVEDQEGVRTSVTDSVAIFDDQLDGASFPADVWALSSGDPPGTTVAVGAASGSDSCAGQVLVLGDIPEGNRFPDGLSLVKWTVDDGNGNVAWGTQKIFVLTASYFPPPVASISASSLVGFDGTLFVDFGTLPQGQGMTVDEYLVVTRFDGTRWSIDARGRIGRADRLTPRHRGLVMGVAPTSEQVSLLAPGEYFGEEGPYAIEYLLVRPGASPLDTSAIVAWDGVGWTMVR